MALRFFSKRLMRKVHLKGSSPISWLCTWNGWRCLDFTKFYGQKTNQSLPYNRRTYLLNFQRLPFRHSRRQKTLSSGSSSHAPSTRQIEQLLLSKELSFEHGHTSILATCPFCASRKVTLTDKTNKDLTLYINKTTGSHVCKRCRRTGSWEQFKIGMSELNSSVSASSSSVSQADHSSLPEECDRVQQLWSRTRPLSECDDKLRKELNDKFGIQRLEPKSLNKYQVHFTNHKFIRPNGAEVEFMCLAFPWFDVGSTDVQCVKLLQVGDKDECLLEPRHGVSGLFGWNTIHTEAKQVVLTHNEFDAVAVHQRTNQPAVSLPLGTHSLPPEVLPQLEQFEKIILWFGSDVRSRQAANQFSRKLNIKRCFLVRATEEMSFAGALDALNKGQDLNKLIATAQPISHEKIVTFHQLRNDVYGELVNADQVAGVKWTRFPKLSHILKGHRRGELTIFTGPTGAGKTTLLSEMSLDLCLQGVSTLWGSFEIRNVRLIKTMLNQFAGLNLQRNIQQFHYWADKFEALPMYFMSFYGSQSISKVIETMTHAAYVYDIEHVIVDNLQFMTSYLKSEDRFSIQNHAISAFRQFATTKNVHVTLVIHPRKENDDVELQTASIFGTAKASQEADNVMILQDKKGGGGKYLQVTKNRFDGTLGRVPLDFVRETISMSGYGKTLLNSNKTSLVKKEPLVKARIVADVDDLNLATPHPVGKAVLTATSPVRKSAVSSSAPDAFGSGSFRVFPSVERSSKLKNSSKDNATKAIDDNSGDESKSKAQNSSRKSHINRVNDVEKLTSETTNRESKWSESDALQSKSKSIAVRAEIKRRLSGTKLFTKAVNSPVTSSNKKSVISADRK